MNHHPLATAPLPAFLTYYPSDNGQALLSLPYQPLYFPIQPTTYLQPFPPLDFHQAQYNQYLAQAQFQYMMAMQQREQEQYGTPTPDFSELQRLSDEYEPEVTGPLVGLRQLSTNITTEYASADPVFQAKTAALPQKYSHYRTVRGDGRCGWRAVAFGYFETLIHLGETNKILEEESRLRSLSNVLNAAGFDPMLYEDFADETFELLRKIKDSLQSGNAEDVLLEAFNNEELQNYIITHLKTLTAGWMKTRQEEYAPWLLGQSVEDYTNAQVMPIGSEIDHVGLSALKDVFLSPAGITLEILYLDRSEGQEANMHRFSPVDNGGIDVGTVRLLYRPGHYDLLYQLNDIPQPPAVVQAYVQFCSQPYPDRVPQASMSDLLLTIPGMSYPLQNSGLVAGPNDAFQGLACSPPTATIPKQAVKTLISPNPTEPSFQPPQEQTYRPFPQDSALQTKVLPLIGGPFRRSVWELDLSLVDTMSQLPPQTSVFKNSCHNKAHFLNPEFHPEQWHPIDEESSPTTTQSQNKTQWPSP